MPTYDYKCKECDHRWELFQPITAKAVRKCPDCGKLKAQRVIGPGAGVIFKGSGFYQTDYRSSAYKKAAEADRQSQSGGSDSKSSGDGDSKSSGGGDSKSSGGSESKGSSSSGSNSTD